MSRRPPQNGLFCWWLPWAGSTGVNQLIDRSNCLNHGTMSGFTGSSDWVVDGGWALNFDGTNNYVVSEDYSTFRDALGGRRFTFSGWMKTATAGFGQVFGGGVVGVNDPSIFIRASTTTNTLLNFLCRNAAGTVNWDITSTSAVNTDKWIHVAAVVGGSGSVGARLYINGIEEASQVTLGGNQSTTWERFGIGASFRAAIGTFFNGCLDDVRLYNRALTASDVRSLYLCGRGAGFRESTVSKYNLALTQDISLNTIAATTTVYNPTVAATANVNLNAIAATTTVRNPTITTTANINLNRITATTNVYQPTIVTGDFINLNLIPATTQVYQPTLTAGAVNISLNLLAATTTVYNPTVELIAESADKSDILNKPSRKKRKRTQQEIEEENVAAQILQERQLKGVKQPEPKQPFNIKLNLEQNEIVPVEIEIPKEMSLNERQKVASLVESYQNNIKRNKQLRALLMLATMDEL